METFSRLANVCYLPFVPAFRGAGALRAQVRLSGDSEDAGGVPFAAQVCYNLRAQGQGRPMHLRHAW